HPRTKKRLAEIGCFTAEIVVINPVSYFEMLLLESRAQFILTDSGGVQKEAYFFRVPCITLRDETEWVETLENRCNVLTGSCGEAILTATRALGSEGAERAAYWFFLSSRRRHTRWLGRDGYRKCSGAERSPRDLSVLA